ncbi:MAG: methylated-DNA--[protein]-cysteine S-methyltransferase [Campylobacteraceae bacterium]|nr:methylated-DNA--[protein]-cysteine S-methyltransferase [Campylobacteraceae bacterium]
MDTLTISTPLGTMLAKADKNGICLLDFAKSNETFISDNPLLLTLATELDEYFEGKRREFTVPLAPVGTPFQLGVWGVLQRIPYGETVSYAKEAAMLGRPSAVRAVANANGKNPIAIIIPCHRIIASVGGIGGYSGGVWRKEFLLSLEAKHSGQ